MDRKHERADLIRIENGALSWIAKTEVVENSVVISLLYLPQAQLVVVAFLNDVCTSRV